MTYKQVLQPMKPEPCVLARIWLWWARMCESGQGCHMTRRKGWGSCGLGHCSGLVVMDPYLLDLMPEGVLFSAQYPSLIEGDVVACVHDVVTDCRVRAITWQWFLTHILLLAAERQSSVTKYIQKCLFLSFCQVSPACVIHWYWHTSRRWRRGGVLHHGSRYDSVLPQIRGVLPGYWRSEGKGKIIIIIFSSVGSWKNMFIGCCDIQSHFCADSPFWVQESSFFWKDLIVWFYILLFFYERSCRGIAAYWS